MRAFVAIDLPEGIRAGLARTQAALQAACSHNGDIRWRRANGLHLTLKFLGEISADQKQAVIAALRGVGWCETVTVEVKGFGFFPNARHPRVLWAGIDAPSALGELAGKVNAVLEEFGFGPEEREFRPHLTLARFRNGRPDAALEAALKEFSSRSLGAFEVTEYYLFESRLKPGGAEYSKLARFAAPGHPSA